jgi:7,8-dihydro-6-hydroxymethylpterin-pyrophosphokinase
MSKTAYIGIGSNEGLARENCEQAVNETRGKNSGTYKHRKQNIEMNL